ncbi:MAG: DUF935 domain-containing protein [Zoogloeaceae bacterium]|jgi:phage gp29-like protein|nr:DUF935 domain-containing protein [Zoogloeaceae bacterium]
MTKAKGLWVSPDQFVSFAEPKKKLARQIATRERSIDFFGLSLYLPNPDPVLKALGKDIAAYRDLCADAHVGGCIRRRKAAVLALERGLKNDGGASARMMKNVQAMLADLPINRMLSEMLDSVLYGYQPMEILWKKSGSFIVPADVVGKPPEWFCFDPQNRLRFRSRENLLEGELLPDRAFLLPRQDPTYQNPYGFPDLSLVFWPTTFKKGGLKFWVQFTEKYGAPWVIGKHPRGTPDSETDAFLDRLEQMVQDAVAVIPDDSSVEVMETANGANNAEVYERLLTFCRAEVSIALLGQNQTTEKDSTRASAQAGIEVTRDIRDGDKRIVEEAMNMLIRWLCELNFGHVAMPTWALWEQEAVDTIRAERDEKLVNAGIRFTPAYFKRTYGLEDGDLADDATPPTMPAPADFAEAAEFPDQLALDDLLDLPPEEMDAATRSLLAPLLAAIEQGVAPDVLLGMLSELEPQMDASALEEQLARLLFLAEVWGAANGRD